MPRKSTDTIKLQLRLPERLRRRLEKAAETHEWSMNFEIVSRLEASFRRQDMEADFERMAERAGKEGALAALKDLREQEGKK
jgi:Arc-like DNA binding domain